MPPEPKQAKLRRKASRKELDEFRFDGTHARELELKRNRGVFRPIRSPCPRPVYLYTVWSASVDRSLVLTDVVVPIQQERYAVYKAQAPMRPTD